jgi:iron complex outermembrane receptor protein
MNRQAIRLLATAAFLTSGAANAQDKGAQGADDQLATSSEDIIVTARRREESAQSVPISITAFGTEALRERSVRELGDITTLVPGIRFVHQGGGSNMNITLRGLSRAPIGDGPNAVITYFADVPLNFQGSNISSYDLANIQVLKGPQGTLFGRNTIGGAVVVTPQGPTYDLQGYVQGSLGNLDFRDIEGALNIPIVDEKAAVRLAGKLSRRDGYTHNIGIGRDPDDRHQNSFRVSVLLEPTENLSNLTVLDYFRATEAGVANVLWRVVPGGVIRIPQLASFWDCHTANEFNPTPCAGFQPTRDIDDALANQQQVGPRQINASLAPNLFRKIWGISNKTELTFGDITLRNIAGYRNTRSDTDVDIDALPFFPPIIQGSQRFASKQYSNELQILGTALDGRLDFIFGGFYLYEDQGSPAGGRFNIASLGAPWISGFNDRRNKALFAQVGYDLSSLAQGLKLTAGYRYSWDSAKMCTVTSPGSTNNPGVLEDECPDTAGHSFIRFKGKAPTWTLGLDWQATEKVLAYAVTRRGYREGGINAPAFNSPGTAILIPYQTFDPEKLTDIEIGLKAEWNVGGVRGRFNIAAYRAKHSNVQVDLSTAGVVAADDPAAPQFTAIGANYGSRILKGIETELVIRPTRTLTISNNAAYNKTKFGELPPVPIPGLIPPPQAARSPKWATTTAVRWEVPLRPLESDLVLGADYYWQSRFAQQDGILPSYDSTNARLELNRIGGSAVDAAVFVRNVFDQENLIAGSAVLNSLGIYTASYQEPRVYGLEVRMRF